MIRFVATPESQSADELREFFRRIRQPGADERCKIAGAVRQGVARNFTSQRAGDGPFWQRLAPSTVLDRLMLGYAGERPILVRSGSFRDSHTNPANPDHREEWETTAEGYSVEIGSRDERDAVLQGGQIGPSFVIPPRPVSVLDSLSERQLGDTLDWIFDQAAPG